MQATMCSSLGFRFSGQAHLNLSLCDLRSAGPKAITCTAQALFKASGAAGPSLLCGAGRQPEQIREAVEEYAGYNVFQLEYPRPEEPTVLLQPGDLPANLH